MTKAELLQTAKPILFNADMVRAILEGRKTVTRRICRDGNDYTEPDISCYDADKRTYAVYNYANKEHTDKLIIAERTCPVCPGDILYVRETWKIHALSPSFCMMVRYRADNFCDIQVKFSPSRFDKFQKFYEKNGWHSALFMPKEVARIFLKVTDVRVERLQAMTLDDFLNEGAVIRPEAFNDPDNAYLQARDVFVKTWDSTVKKEEIYLYGWDGNPWVWVIEFEQVL